MQLKRYLISTMKPKETMYQRQMRFGRELGVTMHAVRKWLNGDRHISDPYKMKIVRLTSGQVRLEDLVHWN